jgi:hypothetical protein
MQSVEAATLDISVHDTTYLTRYFAKGCSHWRVGSRAFSGDLSTRENSNFLIKLGLPLITVACESGLEGAGGTMHTAYKMTSQRLLVIFRDRHVHILRTLIILCCFAALGLVLFGRNVAAIILAVAIGSAWLLRSEI